MTVHLVGAGCGTPLWLTIEGKRLLEGAEAVVYDDLIHPDLLQLVPPGASLLPAEKRKGRRRMEQEEINGLLIRLGRAVRSVVRLKGGDPFVFGRGGEEAQALEAAGISWTYTPGITAAIGGAGRAGLPVTHRGASESVVLAIGHSQNGEGINPGLLRGFSPESTTLAVYMGASSWGETARLLLESGAPSDTPCAAVTRGGWGRGARRLFSLDGKDEGIPSPSVLLAGGSARIALSPERGPLDGLRVGVVRPAPESWDTARLLETMGAVGYSLPLLKTEERDIPDEEERLARADWLVLTSPRGAARLLRRTDPRRLRGKIASIGPGTTETLAKSGIRADLEASPPTSEGLAALLSTHVRRGERVVLFRNEAGSPLPAAAASASGGIVDEMAPYRMVPSSVPGEESYEALWDEMGLHALVFGSEALVHAWRRSNFRPRPEAIPVVWGGHCAKAIEALGGVAPAVMASPTLPCLVEQLIAIRKEMEEEL